MAIHLGVRNNMQSPSIVPCDKSHLEQRCQERGYSLAEVMPCVVLRDGDRWHVDIAHPAYPRVSRIPRPGTELKALLSRVGITSTPNCKCNKRAELMDSMGPEWCRANEDVIVGWLKEEAEKRKLPFVPLAAKLLVRRAISNAEKKANSK